MSYDIRRLQEEEEITKNKHLGLRSKGHSGRRTLLDLTWDCHGDERRL